VSGAQAVVDSSGWIEVFTNGPLAERFIAVLEVFKWVLREHSEAQAIQAVAVMQLSSAMRCGSDGRQHHPGDSQKSSGTAVHHGQ
jgi:hypothetical protein